MRAQLFRAAICTFPTTALAMVKSMRTSAFVFFMSASASFASTISAPKKVLGLRLMPPTSSMSGASWTIRPMVCPILPEAPHTITFIMI